MRAAGAHGIYAGPIAPGLPWRLQWRGVLATLVRWNFTVEFEIGFIAEHSMILFLTHILKCSNPLWLALSQALAFAYFPCSEVLHVKCRLLPEDLVYVAGHRRYFCCVTWEN